MSRVAVYWTTGMLSCIVLFYMCRVAVYWTTGMLSCILYSTVLYVQGGCVLGTGMLSWASTMFCWDARFDHQWVLKNLAIFCLL